MSIHAIIATAFQLGWVPFTLIIGYFGRRYMDKRDKEAKARQDKITYILIYMRSMECGIRGILDGTQEAYNDARNDEYNRLMEEHKFNPTDFN